MAIIYKTTNLVNGMIYVGQHYTDKDDGYLGSGKLLKLAVKEYKRENFIRGTLEVVEDIPTILNEKEIYWISKLDATNPSVGYNICQGGDGTGNGKDNPMYGKTHTPETRQKMKDSHANVDEKNNPMWGKKHTPEAIQKMSDAKKGENNYWYGKTHTLETKQKLRDNHHDQSGENHPNYGKRGKDTSMYGEKHTPEAKIKMSKANSGENNPMWGKKGEDSPNFGSRRTEKTKENIRMAKVTKKEIIEQVLFLLAEGHSVARITEELNIGNGVVYRARNTTYFHDIYDL
jgi:group I intron endonuclease